MRANQPKSRANIQPETLSGAEGTSGNRQTSSSSAAVQAEVPILKAKTTPQVPETLLNIYRGISDWKKNAYLDAMILPQNASDRSNVKAESGTLPTIVDPQKLPYEENSEQLIYELMRRGEFELLGWLLENCPRISDERGCLEIGPLKIVGKQGTPHIDSLAAALNRAPHPFRKHAWVWNDRGVSQSLLTKCEKFSSFLIRLSLERAEMFEHAASNPNIKGLAIVIGQAIPRFAHDDPNADPFRELRSCLPRMTHLENFVFIFAASKNFLPEVSKHLLGLLENARNLAHLDFELYPDCHDDLCRLLQSLPKLSGFVFRPPQETRSDASEVGKFFASEEVLRTLNTAVLVSTSIQFLGFPDFDSLDNKNQVLNAIPDHASLTMLNLGLPDQFSVEGLHQIKAWLSTRSQIIQVFGPVDKSIAGQPLHPVDDVSTPFWKMNSARLKGRESVFLDICELLEKNYQRASLMQTFGASFARTDDSKPWIHRKGLGFASEDASKLLVDWIYVLSPTVDEFKRVMIPVVLSLNALDNAQSIAADLRSRRLQRSRAEVRSKIRIVRRESPPGTLTQSTTTTATVTTTKADAARAASPVEASAEALTSISSLDRRTEKS